ncbi:hypothetical protein ABID14_001529 [Peptoniphilus olsenii]|uniref:Uncharacterized protein n=1 Tax=Peptoniphilus olsenii TaxID=411570 RepID=A0ABV2JAT7_9FIRM
MKRITRMAVALFILISIVIGNAFASVNTLWRASDYTFVKSEHGDNFLADTYIGTASVRGRDRGVSSDGRNIYYTWTRITYDVQGDIQSATAESGGKYNSN